MPRGLKAKDYTAQPAISDRERLDWAILALDRAFRAVEGHGGESIPRIALHARVRELLTLWHAQHHPSRRWA